MNIKRGLVNDVQKRRVHKGIRQSDLAKAVGMSTLEIGLIERRRVTPTFNHQKKLAEYFGIRVDQLFYKENTNG